MHSSRAPRGTQAQVPAQHSKPDSLPGCRLQAGVRYTSSPTGRQPGQRGHCADQEALLHTLHQTQDGWCLLGRWARSRCGEGKARCLTIHESLNTRLPPTTTDFGLDDEQMIILHLTKRVWLGTDTMSCSKSHHTSFHCALRRGGWYKTISFVRAHPLTPKS